MAMQTPEITDEIIATCQAANVQLMDGTMWMHNERTGLMQETIAARLEPNGLGPLKAVTATFCFAGQYTPAVTCCDVIRRRRVCSQTDSAGLLRQRLVVQVMPISWQMIFVSRRGWVVLGAWVTWVGTLCAQRCGRMALRNLFLLVLMQVSIVHCK